MVHYTGTVLGTTSCMWAGIAGGVIIEGVMNEGVYLCAYVEPN